MVFGVLVFLLMCSLGLVHMQRRPLLMCGLGLVYVRLGPLLCAACAFVMRGSGIFGFRLFSAVFQRFFLRFRTFFGVFCEHIDVWGETAMRNALQEV